MIKSKKQMFVIVGAFILILLLGTTTYAFFNYTRTGSSNVIKVGRISFVSKNEQTITLNNLFPIDPSNTTDMNDSTKVGTYSIDIKGDTDYVDGIEYLVSAVDANIYTNQGQIVPITLDFTVTDLGDPSTNYFTARESKNANIYKKLVGDTLVGDGMLLVGYIKPNTTSGQALGVDGNITIKAYLDKNKILISDTYDGTESDNMGTTNNQAEGKTVITTTEWNAIKDTGISFKIKVEANEGIWVIGSLQDVMRKENIGIDIENGVIYNKNSYSDYSKGVYTFSGTQNNPNPIMYYRGEITNNNVMFANKCWKALRTTDTGGVKMIYNGELTESYSPDAPLDRSYYVDVETPDDGFRFDSTDNSWNTVITDGNYHNLFFQLSQGDNYSAEVTGTRGASCSTTINFYKNGSIINSYSDAEVMDYTYNYGTLTSDDLVKIEYAGSSYASCPVTLKIKMKRNNEVLTRSDYNFDHTRFEFDSNTNIWSSVMKSYHTKSISFKVSEADDYFIVINQESFENTSVYRNGTFISRPIGTSYLKLKNVQPSEVITIKMSGKSDRKVEIYLAKKDEGVLACDNNGQEAQISLNVNGEPKNIFNYSTVDGQLQSVAYIGYMIGTIYPINTSWVSGARFGTSYTWDGQYYRLNNDTVTTPDSTHHYSCNMTTANGSCTSLRFLFSTYGRKGYIVLQNGKGVTDALNEMLDNKNDSYAKTIIDRWYEENMVDYTNKIEDTVYCSDRRISALNGWDPNGGRLNEYDNMVFMPDARLNNNNPILDCEKKDSFTVNNSVGNKLLTYPIALITSDEAILAKKNGFLATGEIYYTMSPSALVSREIHPFLINGQGSASRITMGERGIRPVISVKANQLIKKGTGTVLDPYVIE